VRIVPANANYYGLSGLAAVNNLLNPQKYRQVNPFNPLFTELSKVDLGLYIVLITFNCMEYGDL